MYQICISLVSGSSELFSVYKVLDQSLMVAPSGGTASFAFVGNAIEMAAYTPGVETTSDELAAHFRQFVDSVLESIRGSIVSTKVKVKHVVESGIYKVKFFPIDSSVDKAIVYSVFIPKKSE